MQQVDGPLPILDHVFFTQVIGTTANIAPAHGHVYQKTLTQVLFDLPEGFPSLGRRKQSLGLCEAKRIA